MRSFVVIAVILGVTGAVLRPFISGAGTDSPLTVESPAVAADRSQAAPPAIAEFRGTAGYWRIGKTAEGVWWFIAPDGTPDWLNTVTTVVPFQLGRDAEGPHYYSADWTGENPEQVKAWAAATLPRVKEFGFKGLGAWCHQAFHELDVPITRDLNVSTYMQHDARRFYSPGWAETAEKAIVDQVTPLRENKNLVGYFIDNELDWGEGGAGPRVYFDNLSVEDPNRAAVMRVIQKNWETIEQFNADWKTSFSSFDTLATAMTLPNESPDAYAKLFSAWLESMARDYFTLTTSLIRKHDPNHLILGVRFKGRAPREVVRASNGLTDVQSINYYVADGKLDRAMFDRMHHESGGQPVMITEYAFHALDGRSGNRNTFGFDGQVVDQQARAEGYKLFTSRFARVPYIIGADWFQWNDEPPSGRRVDGEDVNFGMVDVDDQPYQWMRDAVLATTPKLNDLHATSAKEDGNDIWRPETVISSTTIAPYLKRRPTLNGELSDWPAAATLQGVRVAETIGQDRRATPKPIVKLGWHDDGLYLGFEVHDNDIRGAAPNGLWWTRDCVEFWIATQPIAPDQEIYDHNCHQFYVVPVDSGEAVGGVAGQWHRPGDNLQGHLIPHPLIRQVTRVRHDRYVMELFIPRAALHGFDPEKNNEISFNMHVRDFQHATDFFWSAPKEVATQLRPGTWGRVQLGGK